MPWPLLVFDGMASGWWRPAAGTTAFSAADAVLALVAASWAAAVFCARCDTNRTYSGPGVSGALGCGLSVRFGARSGLPFRAPKFIARAWGRERALGNRQFRLVGVAAVSGAGARARAFFAAAARSTPLGTNIGRARRGRLYRAGRGLRALSRLPLAERRGCRAVGSTAAAVAAACAGGREPRNCCYHRASRQVGGSVW